MPPGFLCFSLSIFKLLSVLLWCWPYPQLSWQPPCFSLGHLSLCIYFPTLLLQVFFFFFNLKDVLFPTTVILFLKNLIRFLKLSFHLVIKILSSYSPCCASLSVSYHAVICISHSPHPSILSLSPSSLVTTRFCFLICESALFFANWDSLVWDFPGSQWLRLLASMPGLPLVGELGSHMPQCDKSKFTSLQQQFLNLSMHQGSARNLYNQRYLGLLPNQDLGEDITGHQYF